ncbi:hypothetical protein [Bacillus weihaiensis]|uniref:Band 7 domain-containing protein n=1 Tax=Bacillus weihaiensis TaxID=1547283 RepID=A0A1L3MMG9_9BACI|nr:hypothetical protein [Bacillus weihaiensis]APH03539.1 hypothetical protein A9C19_01540 [Bacillus weihaiensis]
MNLIEVHPVKFNFFEKPPASSMNQAFVYVNAQNNFQVVKNGDRLTRSDLRAGKYTKMYIVNMGTQNFHDENEYPSLDRGRSFLIDVSIDYKVVDPISLVQQDAGEIVTYIKKKLPYWLEEITTDYPISDAKRVKKHIEDLHEHSSMVTGLKQVGIVVADINVLVKQSRSDQEHDRSYWQIDKDGELAEHEIEIKQRRALALAEKIQTEIESGHLLKALMLAEDNKPALEIVQNRLALEEKFRADIKDQVRMLLADPTADKMDVEKQVEKIQAYFPYEQFGRSSSESSRLGSRYHSNKSSDEEDSVYQTTKGDQ